MKVKRYLANDVNEAMIKIRSELGRDAVILHSRKIKRPGIQGLFSKAVYEVVAAIDEEKEQRKPEQLSGAKKTEEPTLLKQIPLVIPPEKSKSEMNNREIESLKEQMSSIKSMLSTVMEKIQNPAEPNEVTRQFESESVCQGSDENMYRKILLKADIMSDHAEKILDLAKRRIALTKENQRAVMNAIRIVLKDQLGEPYTIGDEQERAKICFFVGPTGVGKTTTLAKLAARLSLVDNRNVGLITADTFRIAAVEQLKTYSEILGIPLTVIYEAEEMNDALHKYRDKDYILVDTAGRSHKNEELESDLSNLIQRVENPEIFLVISLTTGYKDIESILESYQFLGDYKLLFTKLDEASSVGNILNARVASGKPLSYFAIGQSVPDDIEIADSEKVARKLLGELS